MDYDLLLHKLAKEMNLVENIYDNIRLVDPVKKKVLSYFIYEPMKEAVLQQPCYQTWNEKTCANCTSARALKQNKTIVKIEFRESQVYLVTSVPAGTEDNQVVVELYKDITESGILDIDGKDLSEIHKLVNRRNLRIITDAITRIYNSEFIYDRLPFDIFRSHEEMRPLALIYTEIGNLKIINDMHGLKAGDYIIKKIAKIVRYYLRNGEDWTARFNNSGFVIILHDSDEKKIYAICKRLSNKIDKTEFVFGGKIIKIEQKIGWHVLHDEMITVDEFVNKAIRKAIPEKFDLRSKSFEQFTDEFFKKFYLTAREKDVANLILKGYSNAQIAQELFIGNSTVKKHVSAIFEKSGLTSRNEFIAKYSHMVN